MKDADQYIDRPEDVTQRGLLIQPAVYAAVCFLLLLLLPEVPLLARIVLIAGVLMTLRRWGGVVVLLLVQGDLFLREGRQIPPLRGAEGLVLAFVAVAVLMFVSRQRLLLANLAGMSISDLFRRWTGREDDSGKATTDNLSTRRANSSFEPTTPQMQATETKTSSDRVASTFQTASVAVFDLIPAALRGLSLILICVTTARFLLSRIPRNSELTGQLRDVVNADPTLASGGLVLMVLLALWVIVGEVSWRQLTPGQARVYLRSELLRETYADLRMFVLRRIRVRQKRLLAAKSTSGKSDSTTPPGTVKK